MSEFEKWFALAQSKHSLRDYADSSKACWNAALEAAAKVCKDEANLRERCGDSHPAESAERDRCYAGARAATNCEIGVIALKEAE